MPSETYTVDQDAGKSKFNNNKIHQVLEQFTIPINHFK